MATVSALIVVAGAFADNLLAFSQRREQAGSRQRIKLLVKSKGVLLGNSQDQLPHEDPCVLTVPATGEP
jgi:hypothetical protein